MPATRTNATAKVVPLPDQPRRRRPRKPAPEITGLTLHEAFESWARALKARRRQPTTIESYLVTVDLFAKWLAETGGPDDVERITVEHIREFITTEGDRTSAGNAHKHYRNLRAMFRWCIAEDPPLRSTPSPVLKADEPHVTEVELPPLTDEQVWKILATCKGKSFRDVRDLAIFYVLIDAGTRRTGLADIRYTPGNAVTHDVDLDRNRLRILLKGGDIYYAPIGAKTVQVLDRYLRMRAKHKKRTLPWLWLSPRGHLTQDGLYQMVKLRGEQAGIPAVTPHQFRRTSVTAFLDAGGSELAAQHIYGWKSTAMVRHYSKATARERARDEHGRLSPGDRF